MEILLIKSINKLDKYNKLIYLKDDIFYITKLKNNKIIELKRIIKYKS